MVRVLRREQLQAAAVEADAVQVLKVGITIRLAAIGHEVDRACFLVDAQDVADIAVATRYAVLEGAGCQIIQIEVYPVVTLRPPDELIGRRENAPQILGQRRVADLRCAALLEQRPHLARPGVRHPEPRVLVISGARDERQMRSIGVPLHVADGTAAGDVIGHRRPVRVGRHLKPDDSRRAIRSQRDDHAADTENHAVTRHRVLPRFETRGADVGRHEVHVADPAAVVLERGELPGIVRPRHDGIVAVHPACVVRGVPEILDAVRRELAFRAIGECLRPQVVVADVHGPLAIRRYARILWRPGWCGTRAGVRLEIAREPAIAQRHHERPPVAAQFECLEREPVPVDGSPGGGGQRRGETRMIERRGPRALCRVHREERAPRRRCRAIEEAAVSEPDRPPRDSTDQRCSVRSEILLGTLVIGGGKGAGFLRGEGRER